MAMDGSATTIEVTPEAATKLQELRADDPKRAFLRLYVSGRSCCSFMYGLAFDENADETDAVTNAAGLTVAIDAQSLPYCDGAKVEWVDGPEGTGFLVRNASLGGSCACGGLFTRARERPPPPIPAIPGPPGAFPPVPRPPQVG